MSHEKSKDELIQEWNQRAKRPGELAVMSSQFPKELCDEESQRYANAVMSFMATDLDGKNVLEIGSGIGRLTEHIVLKAAKLTCIDPSTEMIKRNKERLGAKADQITYLNIFADEYGPHLAHDVVVCSLVLAHVPDNLFPKVVEVLAMCANTLFLFEHTGNESQISDYTFGRSEEDLVKAFATYHVERRHKYQHFFNEISFLKLIRVSS